MLQQQPLIRTGGLRCFYLDGTVAQGLCYVDGERFEFGAALQQTVVTLCDNDTLTAAQLQTAMEDDKFSGQFTTWVNEGFWYFED